MANEQTVSDVVAARVRQVRKRRDLTTDQLAARCAELGEPELTTQALYKLEARRPGKLRPRPVTVDELLTLAAALNVAPVHLLVPIDDFGESYRVTGEVSERAGYIREWIRGKLPLPGADPREFFSQVPRTEYDWQFEGVSWPVPAGTEDDDGER
jgi:transcriptional regulator with XRE-family HTH domain